MIRRKGPLLAVAVVAAFALGWYRGLFGLDQVTSPTPPTPSLEAASTKPAEPAAPSASETTAEIAPAGTPDPAVKADAAPGFDVVRVEPDGSAVIAGRGIANGAVALSDGTRSFGEAKTDANGDFVMTLSLPTGSHRLQLEQQGTGSVSPDAAVVNVPPKGQPHELLVMMERAGQPAEVLVRPSPEPQQTVAAVGEPSKPESQPAAVASTEPSGAAVAKLDALAVEAVEVEGGKLFVAGAASETSKVRVYLDDKLVAETKGGEGERFIASASAQVPIGDHTIRADEVDAAGQVVGRVEVPFQRPSEEPMAAVAPAASVGTAAAQTEPGVGELRTTVQAPLEAAAARVIIRRGDTLWRISRATYGRGSRYTVIYLANGDQIRDPNRIYPGQVFRMPDRDKDESKG